MDQEQEGSVGKVRGNNYIYSLVTEEFWHQYMIAPSWWAAVGDNALHFVFPRFILLNQVLIFFTEFALLGKKQSRLYNTVS